MSFLERIKKYKEDGQGLNIIIILNILFFGIATYRLFSRVAGAELRTYALLILSILPVLILAFTSIFYEKKGYSLVAHFLLLSTFLPDEIRKAYFYVVNGVNIEGAELLFLILGFFASLYAFLKVIVHLDELKSYFVKPKSQVVTIIIVMLLGTYLSIGFNGLILSVVITLAIIFTGRSKETLIYAIAIFGGFLLNDAVSIFSEDFFNNSFNDIVLTMLSFAINSALIYYSFKLYNEDKIEIVQ